MPGNNSGSGTIGYRDNLRAYVYHSLSQLLMRPSQLDSSGINKRKCSMSLYFIFTTRSRVSCVYTFRFRSPIPDVLSPDSVGIRVPMVDYGRT